MLPISPAPLPLLPLTPLLAVGNLLLPRTIDRLAHAPRLETPRLAPVSSLAPSTGCDIGLVAVFRVLGRRIVGNVLGMEVNVGARARCTLLVVGAFRKHRSIEEIKVSNTIVVVVTTYP